MKKPAGYFALSMSGGRATLRTSQRPLYGEIPFAEDGNPATNPADTIQAITVAADLPFQNGCPVDTNCFDVVLTNFTSQLQGGVFMGIDAISPATGRALIGSDAVPTGVTAPLGGRSFGDLGIGGSSGTVEMNFSIPNGDAYVVVGRFWGNVAQIQNLDQDQPSGPVYMAGFSQGDLAQSFQTQAASQINGAGVLLQSGIGTTGTVEIQLWDALPNAPGAAMLATGSAVGTAGSWVDVEWAPVAIAQNTTYFLVFLPSNNGLGIAGDTANPYPFGEVYANPGFEQFGSFDYTFRTFSP